MDNRTPGGRSGGLTTTLRLPMPRHRAVTHLGGAVTDQQAVIEETGAAALATALRLAHGSPSAQRAGKLPAQLAAANGHRSPDRSSPGRPASVRRVRIPGPAWMICAGDHRFLKWARMKHSDGGCVCTFDGFGPLRPGLGQPISRERPIPPAHGVGVAAHLPADRLRRPTQLEMDLRSRATALRTSGMAGISWAAASPNECSSNRAHLATSRLAGPAGGQGRVLRPVTDPHAGDVISRMDRGRRRCAATSTRPPP